MTTTYRENFSKCFPFSDTGLQTILVANTALSWTVPGLSTENFRAKFSVSPSSDVWVRLGGTATLPTSGVATQSYNQERIDINFTRYVKGGDILSFISSGTPQVGVSLLLVQKVS